MKRLECARFTIQPQYGYGADGNAELEVPGNATLVYEIRLNNFTKVHFQQLIIRHYKYMYMQIYKKYYCEFKTLLVTSLTITPLQVKQAWEYDSLEERVTDAGHLKERGTKYFKLGKYQLACKLYGRGAELFNNVNDMDDNAKVMQVALHLNQAACHLKLGEPSLAINECEEVCEYVN